ncbi:MAG: L-threonylcarbamoyladenylate synthase [Nitrospinota bacterium]|nr:L-threonylcarbamoyladenylate synthase [Nitrospinota bacterium]MEC9423942.1 L-threonylcarbamoyladenylate synthase [Nitrospinota bacterium]MEE3253803.1 L-threonylcarbamoyladenylate synthase [Nitrospinota bacterium]
MPQILKVKTSNPESWGIMIAETQKILEGGGVIAFPTDTFYGLGANPYNTKAVDKIYSIKGRDPEKPLLLLIDSLTKLDGLVEEISEAGTKLIESFWPGPLTMLFKPKHTIPKNITTGLIGIRQPGNSLTRKILAGLNYPLTAPSANISGEDPATTAEQVKDRLGNKVDLILDSGICRGGKPSTLLDTTQIPVRLIRAGAINFKSIQDSLSEISQIQESL